MTRIIVDASLRSKLRNFSERLELCDESGRVLAEVQPVRELDPSEWEPWEPPPLSKAELERRRHEPGYSIEEVMEHLKRLESR
jgi:hypothetical protein